jgi:hypothetical protein
MKCLPLLEFCSRDVTSVKINWRTEVAKGDLIVSSVYLPYDRSELLPTRELELLVEYFMVKWQHLLIGCDSNAHHVIWGSGDTNARGESLLNFIVANNLAILNVRNRPTFINRVRQEVLDITLSTEYVSTLIQSWHVSEVQPV